MASDSAAGGPAGGSEASEALDLDEDRRRYLDDAYAQLDRLNHYALLGVPRTADAKAVKNAYFRLTGLVHPDRYFGKRLGGYKAKMEAIFTRMTTAYETLKSAERRAEYDATLVQAAAAAAASGEHPAVQGRAPVDPRVAAQRQAALEGLQKHFAEGKAKAAQYAEAANRARAAGDVTAAAEAYKRALTFTPNDTALAAAYEEVQRAAASRLVESHVRKALLEEKLGRWDAAVESWQRAATASPDDAQVQARLADACARARRA